MDGDTAARLADPFEKRASTYSSQAWLRSTGKLVEEWSGVTGAGGA